MRVARRPWPARCEPAGRAAIEGSRKGSRMGCMNYLVGDLQGCCDALQRLLEKIDFSASRDRLWLLGDLVNRGPQSLATLRLLHSLDGAATCLLGNHDLHLLAVAAGGRTTRDGDTLDDILDAP